MEITKTPTPLASFGKADLSTHFNNKMLEKKNQWVKSISPIRGHYTASKRRFIPQTILFKIILSPFLLFMFIVVGVLTIVLGLLSIGHINVWNKVFRPHKTILKGRNLSYVVFPEQSKLFFICHRKPVDWRNANLSYAQINTNLLGYINFDGLNGQSVCFNGIKHMDSLSFKNATLTNASFIALPNKKNVKPSDSPLPPTSEPTVYTKNCDFTGANLQGATFANMGHLNFTNANLQGATLTNMASINFTGADLQNATLRKIHIEGLNFTDAIFNNKTSIQFEPCAMTPDLAYKAFNQTPNNDSILTVIHSISPKDNKLRHDLMAQVIKKIFCVDNLFQKDLILKECSNSFMAIFEREDSNYLENHTCKLFSDMIKKYSVDLYT